MDFYNLPAMKYLIPIALCMCAWLTGCADMSGMSDGAESGRGNFSHQAAASYQAKKIQGGIAITRGGVPVSTIRTAMPNVENWKFINGGQQVVTKSRGNHGPASVEMFDTATGAQRDKILAFAIKSGQPAWAAEYAE